MRALVLLMGAVVSKKGDTFSAGPSQTHYGVCYSLGKLISRFLAVAVTKNESYLTLEWWQA